MADDDIRCSVIVNRESRRRRICVYLGKVKHPAVSDYVKGLNNNLKKREQIDCEKENLPRHLADEEYVFYVYTLVPPIPININGPRNEKNCQEFIDAICTIKGYDDILRKLRFKISKVPIVRSLDKIMPQ